MSRTARKMPSRAYQAAMLVKEGWRVTKAAKEYGLSSSAVSQECSRQGIRPLVTRRPVAENKAPNQLPKAVQDLDHEGRNTYREMFLMVRDAREAERLAVQDYEVRMRRMKRRKA